MRSFQRFLARLVVLAIVMSLGGCSSDYQSTQREGTALTNLRDNALPAERRDREAKYERCKVALGRYPLAMAENEEAATKFLFPLPACNDYLVAKVRYDRDRQDFLRRAQALDAYYDRQARAIDAADESMQQQQQTNELRNLNRTLGCVGWGC